MSAARLIIDDPASGSWNMALDQALLESTDLRKAITLRIYRWSEPTLSLGYFQRADDRNSHAASLDCSLIRRSSGGGAIVHDDELTYSICVPASNRWSKTSDELYELVHQQVIDLLSEHGIQASLVTSDEAESNANQSFLCFQRRTKGDVVVADSKICGSAQRRLRNALLQHGSLLLRQSAHAPELPGLIELNGSNVEWNTLCHGLADRIATKLNIKFELETANLEELAVAKRIEQERFLSDAWTFKR